jgi:hypothetical protein
MEKVVLNGSIILNWILKNKVSGYGLDLSGS